VDISKIFTEREIDIVSISSRINKRGIATIEVAFRTKGKDELTSLIEKIHQVESVFEIKRTTG
jgi:GTP pyrophosphokinase